MNTYIKAFGFLILGALAAAPVQGAAWLTDLPAAQAQAAREGKTVLINFTGSDWCGWCIKLRNEVFSRPEFDDFASRHLVLVEADFPQRIAQPAALKKANEDMAQRFRITGYPTLILLNAQGKQIGRSSYQAGGAAQFVDRLAKLTGVNYTANPALSRTPGQPPKALPLYGGAAISAPPAYDRLELRSVSGSKNRRFAMINNQTLTAGESARVKLGQDEVRVKCLEIRESSVLVSVAGEKEPREIRLNEPVLK